MNKLKKSIATALMVAVAALGLAGCGGESPAPATATATMAAEATATSPAAETAEVEPTETEAVETPEMATPTMAAETPSALDTPTTGGQITGPAADLINRSSEAMKDVTSYHISMTTEAAGVTATAEGDVVVPDRTRMIVDSGALGQTEVIMIAGTSYIKAPGLDSYFESPGTGQENTTDVSGVLEFATAAEVVGDETVDGVDTTHVTVTYDADKQLEATIAESDQPVPTPAVKLGLLTTDMWIDKSTGYVRQTKTNTSEGNVTIVFSKFNEPVNPPIEKPTNVTTMPGLEITPQVP